MTSRNPGVFIFIGVVVSLLTLAGSRARAEDWAQFRGPNRDGIWRETGLITEIPPEGIKVAWRTPVGTGWSSPVVARGRVYVTDSQLNKPDAKERVLCFDEKTGASLWSFDYVVIYPDWAFVPSQGGAPSATPVVDAGSIYALGPCGQLHCLDAATGNLRWKRELNKEFQIPVLSVRPSPLIDGNLLIVFTGAKPGASVMAIDKATGNDVWKALDDAVSNSSPIIVTAGGVRQLIVWSDDAVTSLNPATGAIYWREPMVTGNNDSIPTPVALNNRLLVSGLMFALAEDRPAASVLWPGINPVAKRLLSNTSTAVLRGDYVYAAKSDGELVCLDAATGKKLWGIDTVTERKTGASINITPAGDAMFLFTDRGDLVLAELTPRGYMEKGRAHLLEPTTPFAGKGYAWSPPAYASKHIFARNDKELICASLSIE